jgi:hypothetical protein
MNFSETPMRIAASFMLRNSGWTGVMFEVVMGISVLTWFASWCFKAVRRDFSCIDVQNVDMWEFCPFLPNFGKVF